MRGKAGIFPARDGGEHLGHGSPSLVAEVHGNPELPGFTLALERVWQPL